MQNDYFILQESGKMAKVTLLLLIIFGGLQYSLWLGKNGIHDYVRINNDIKQRRADNTILKLRNDQLHAEIRDLIEGLDAIEERARTELGMIKPNEQFYRIIKEKP